MTLETLVENAIIADFRGDALLNNYPIRNHDYGGTKTGDDLPTEQEAYQTITVTARDRGDHQVYGCGIRNVGIEVEIRVNGEADNFNGTLLDSLAEKVRDRLQPSVPLGFITQGREISFSNSFVKVFAIEQNDLTPRVDSGFERIRTVTATFIAAQLA